MIKGKAVDYVELLVGSNDMTIAVPMATVDAVGLRQVANKSQLDRLADVFCAETVGEESVWARRIKANALKLSSGEALQIAEVARDLIRRREERGISMGERELLRDALEPLVAEVAIAVDVSEENAEEVITELVLTGNRDILRRVPA